MNRINNKKVVIAVRGLSFSSLSASLIEYTYTIKNLKRKRELGDTGY